MPHTIGGRLDARALGTLHFHTLSHNEQEAAIRRMARAGLGEADIIASSGWSQDMIRKTLAARADMEVRP